MMDDLDPFQSNEEAKPAACVRVGAQMDDLDASDGEGDAKLAASARVGALIHRQRRDRSPPKLDSESQDGAKPMVKEQAKPASPAADRGPAVSLAAGFLMRANLEGSSAGFHFELTRR